MSALRALAADPPDAIVIDLGRLPSQGRAVATALRQQKATRDVPLVFVEGDPEKTARVKALLPGRFLHDVARPGGRAPRRPMKTRTEGEARRPRHDGRLLRHAAPKKLGIKPGSAVALLGAPEAREEGRSDRCRRDQSARTGARPST